MCDTSDIVVGAVPGQRKDKMFRPIYYASRMLNDSQVNYADTEKEFFAVVFAFDKFRSYLVGIKVIIFYIDAVCERPLWYADVAYFLASGWLPRDLSRDQRKKLIDGAIRRCVPEGEMASILSHCYDGATRGHYGGNRTAAKVMEAGFFVLLCTKTHGCMLLHVTSVKGPTVSTSRKDWSVKLDEALWAHKTTFKTTIRTSPFKLVYEKSCHLLVEIEHKAYWAIKMLNLDLSLANLLDNGSLGLLEFRSFDNYLNRCGDVVVVVQCLAVLANVLTQIPQKLPLVAVKEVGGHLPRPSGGGRGAH
ncbi:uncharacterized protein LOC142178273 [Nicotiana tabacum]|uniref:Uncharacterized protein LOC142178273 n=1 Tax=Nicotiana tabacum TaxID=4097 RepID=A0AC58U2K5_TOBAC